MTPMKKEYMRLLSKGDMPKLYKECFSSQAGKFVLMDLQHDLNDETTFCPHDPYTTCFNEGRRSVYLHIISMLEAEEIEDDGEGEVEL